MADHSSSPQRDLGGPSAAANEHAARDGWPDQERAGTSASQPDAKTESKTNPNPTGPDALSEALRRVAEAREYVLYLVAAETDRIKLRLRRLAIWAIVGAVAIILALAVLVSAAALLLDGVAQLLGTWFGGQMWLGALVTGGGVLSAVALTAWLGLRWWSKSSYKAARKRYTDRKRRLRAKHRGAPSEPQPTPVEP